jgi:hypothetical protein
MMVWTMTITIVLPHDDEWNSWFLASCDVIIFSLFPLPYIFSPPSPSYLFLLKPSRNFFLRRWHSVTFLSLFSSLFLSLSLSLSFPFLFLLSTTLKKYDMFFLCGRTNTAIEKKNTKCINYRTNLLFCFYRKKNLVHIFCE